MKLTKQDVIMPFKKYQFLLDALDMASSLEMDIYISFCEDFKEEHNLSDEAYGMLLILDELGVNANSKHISRRALKYSLNNSFIDRLGKAAVIGDLLEELENRGFIYNNTAKNRIELLFNPR